MIRPRLRADVDACVALARLTHVQDDYPVHWPADPARFIAPPQELASWVACEGDEIVGHVALHDDGAPGTIALACATTGLAAGALGVIARLFVGPSARTHGTGSELLAAACAAAHDRGLQPILDVLVRYQDAVRMYDANGWTRAGSSEIAFADGTTTGCYVYLGPPPS